MNLTTLPTDPGPRKFAIPVTPAANALRDLEQLSKELDQPFTETAAMVLQIGITVVRRNWARRDARTEAA